MLQRHIGLNNIFPAWKHLLHWELKVKRFGNDLVANSTENILYIFYMVNSAGDLCYAGPRPMELILRK